MSAKKKAYGRQALLAVISVAVIALIGVIAAVYSLDSSPSSLSEPRIFKVKPGDNASTVAKRLEEGGFIKSSSWFRAYAKLSGKSSQLEAGSYEIAPGEGVSSIVRMMAEGRQAVARVTIPEGFTTGQLASLLEKDRVCSAKAFSTAAKDPGLLSELGIPGRGAEGYLFPDTYDIPLQTEPADIVRMMVKAFRAALHDSLPAAEALSAKDLHDKVILASIVEREYRIDDEAPLMASVFANRLKIGMGLQSCATVVYIMTEREGRSHPEVLSKQDIAIRDPYNTYLYRGLPPGPISNPGLVALRAVFEYPKTDYLYFRLIDPATGAHHFSRTLEEHNLVGYLYTKAVAGSR